MRESKVDQGVLCVVELQLVIQSSCSPSSQVKHGQLMPSHPMSTLHIILPPKGLQQPIILSSRHNRYPGSKGPPPPPASAFPWSAGTTAGAAAAAAAAAASASLR